MFLVVWKHAIMHQNTVLTTPDVKFFFLLVVWKHAQMPQNAFLTSPDVEKYLF